MSSNTKTGTGALNSVTTGQNNSAYGFDALYTLTTSDDNTAVGANAMQDATTAAECVAVGSHALQGCTTSTGPVAVGWYALGSSSPLTASQLTAVGFKALTSTTGEYNTGIGYKAGYQITSGTSNTAVGSNAYASTNSGSNNTCVGAFADLPTGGLVSNTTVLGANITAATSNEVIVANSSQTVLRPDATNTTDLGSTSKTWRKLYLGTGLVLPTNSTGATAGTLDYYENFSTTVSWGGAIFSTSAGMYWERIGKTVNIKLDAVSATTTASPGVPIYHGANTIPPRLAPAANMTYLIRVNKGGTQQVGVLLVQTDGNLTVYPDTALGNWPGSVTCGFSATAVSYNVL